MRGPAATPFQRHALMLRLALAASLLFAFALSASAQTIPLPAAQKVAKPPAEEISPEEHVARLRKNLETARIELERISGPEQLGTGAPPDTAQDELIERRFLWEQLVRLYQSLLVEQDQLRVARQNKSTLEQQIAEWKAFSEPPPYSLLMLDALRESERSVGEKIKALETRRELGSEQQIEEAKNRLRESEARVRQALERIEQNREPAQAERLVFERDLARLRARYAGATAEQYDSTRVLAEEELAEARLESEFVRKKLGVATRAVAFSEADLRKVKDTLEAERRGFESAAQRAADDDPQRRKALSAAQADLQLARAQVSGRPETLSRLEQIVEMRRLQADNTTLQADVLRQMGHMVNAEGRVWEMRHKILASADAAKLDVTQVELQGILDELRKWNAYVRQQIDLIANRVNDYDFRVKNAASPEDAAVARETLEAFREREAIYRQALVGLSRLRGLLERVGAEHDAQRGALSFSQRASTLPSKLGQFARSIWSFELFAAEDTIEVDGRRITGKRSVTVGKVLSVLLMLFVGYWICVFAARLLERTAKRRFGLDADVASLLRKWTLFFLILLLIVFSLMSVNIPFTVFAFFGGALAIGIGFGIQNLLKNLISGMMILIERPLRVGDLVELEGVRGRVMSIGLRSSTIRNADGIETLVPNSTFLEQKVTNWTYSSQQVRFSLQVGVAYGSPTREVSDLLLAAVHEHGLILKDPEPQVLFDDFGTDALHFTLVYWIEANPASDSRRVASDLRHMVDKRFREVGIAMAYPQRDVHLDAAKPLQVEVIPARG